MPMLDVLTLLGPAVCSLGAASHWLLYRRYSMPVEAMIVAIIDCEQKQSTDREYRPVVAFQTVEGKPVTAECEGYHDGRVKVDAFRIGAPVNVFYRPERPEAVILARRYRSMYSTLAVVAVLWLGVALLVRRFPSP